MLQFVKQAILIIWQLPQCVLAWLVLGFLWCIRSLHAIEPFHSAYAVDGGIKGGAFTLGPYVFGPAGTRSTGHDHLLVHEYGHTLQSLILGPFYLLLIGIPSVLSAGVLPRMHNYRWFEVWANRLSLEFGKDHLIGFEPAAFVEANVSSSYINPRNKGHNHSSNPVHVQYRWFDVLLMIPSCLLLYGMYLLALS